MKPKCLHINLLKLSTVLLFMLPFVGFAQLYVGEKVEVYVKKELSSKESSHIFNTSINGIGELHFINATVQQLQSDKSVSIPASHINNVASFFINSSIHVRGDLTLVNSSVYTNEYVLLLGSILADEDSKVFGASYFMENYKHSLYQVSFTNAAETNLLIRVGIIEEEVLHEGLEYQILQKIFTYNSIVKSMYQLSPLTPPPWLV